MRAAAVLTLGASVPCYLAGLGYNGGLFQPFLFLASSLCWVGAVILGVLAIYRVALRLVSPDPSARRPTLVILGAFLVLVNLWTPAGWFMAGVRTRIARIGGAQMVAEGRELIRQFRLHHPDDTSRQAVDDRVVKTPYPPHLAALNPPPAWVWVSRDSLDIKINGFGTFEGFVITADDSQPPRGTRIAEGLYWASHQ